MQGAQKWHPARWTSFYVAGLALLVTLLMPAIHFYHNYHFIAGQLASEAHVSSHVLSQVVSEYPVMWSYQSERLHSQLSRLEPHSNEKRRVIYAEGDRVVVAIGPELGDLPWPRLSREAPIYDAGQEAGRIVATRSVRGLLLNTIILATGIVIVLGAVFIFFFRGPLEQFRRSWATTVYLASHDSLTSLHNRAAFLERLEQHVRNAQQNDAGFALFYLDLDGFKQVNDSLGHNAGDRLLKLVAARLRRCLRETDFLARLSGDEFAIIQSNAEQAGNAIALARRIQQIMASSFDLAGEMVVIRISIGIALYGSHGTSSDELCQRADRSLYKAKLERHSCWYLPSPGGMNEEPLPLPMEEELRRALEQREFRLYFQPQVDLVTGRIHGVEALLRWEHPDRGIVPPNLFVPVAEETGLILPIGAWVIGTACIQALKWPHLTMAVNVSAVQFQQGDLVSEVRRHLDETGLSPGRLELEMTESVLLHDTDQTLATLQQLKAMGVGIIMDDFGTGYSSLSYLHRFSFDKLKIDRSFVGDLGRSGQACTIVRAIVGLGHSLGMRINAEGIEDPQQASKLRFEGCDEGQGYLYGHAVPPEEIEALIPLTTGMTLNGKTKIANARA